MGRNDDKTTDLHVAPILFPPEKITTEVSPKANFACVVLVFLEDWQAGRLTADEVCDTLTAAAVTRKLLRETVPHTGKPVPVRKIEHFANNNKR
jgi:hypothetical protein